MMLHAPEISAKAKPGQFIEIKVNDDSVLLRRPMSIANVNPEKSEITIWYRVVGKGTASLGACKKDDILDIIGPLGNSFYLNPDAKTIALVGGGCGTAPLLFFCKTLAASNPEIKIYAIIGARDKELILGEKEFEKYGAEVLLATNNGSAGIKGFATDALKKLLRGAKVDEVLTCGPEPMMLAVARICQEDNIFCLVSMESPMACGLGACYGCVVKTKIGYRRVCKEGPIFRGSEVLVN